MTETHIATLTAAIPGLEKALRAAIDRAMKPELPPALTLGFLQVIVGMASNLRAYRKAAGLPTVWPPELSALLGSVYLFANERLYDPSLNAPQALRLFRTVLALGRASLQALPRPAKPEKKAPNPFVRSKASALPQPKPIPPLSVPNPTMAEALRLDGDSNPPTLVTGGSGYDEITTMAA